MWPVMHARKPPPNRMTHRCKNITFSQLCLWAVIILCSNGESAMGVQSPKTKIFRTVSKLFLLCIYCLKIAWFLKKARDFEYLPSVNEVAERWCFHKRVSRILSKGVGGVHPPGQTPSRRLPSPYADTSPGQVDTPLGRHPSWAGRHPPEQTSPPADGCCSGRYASYWNAFLVTVKNRRKSCLKGNEWFPLQIDNCFVTGLRPPFWILNWFSTDFYGICSCYRPPKKLRRAMFLVVSDCSWGWSYVTITHAWCIGPYCTAPQTWPSLHRDPSFQTWDLTVHGPPSTAIDIWWS